MQRERLLEPLPLVNGLPHSLFAFCTGLLLLIIIAFSADFSSFSIFSSPNRHQTRRHGRPLGQWKNCTSFLQYRLLSSLDISIHSSSPCIYITCFRLCLYFFRSSFSFLLSCLFCCASFTGYIYIIGSCYQRPLCLIIIIVIFIIINIVIISIVVVVVIISLQSTWTIIFINSIYLSAASVSVL